LPQVEGRTGHLPPIEDSKHFDEVNEKLNAEPDSKFRANALRDKKSKSLATVTTPKSRAAIIPVVVEIPEEEGEKTGGPVSVEAQK
jgi:hypothetical protein